MIVSKPKHITMLELKQKAQKAKGKVNHIYLHWTGAGYEQADDNYHLCVDRLGQVYSCCKENLIPGCETRAPLPLPCAAARVPVAGYPAWAIRGPHGV